MRNGLSRADAIVLAALGILFLVCIPTVFAQADARARELANRATCSANLRGLVQSMVVYSTSEEDWFPCLPPSSATTYDATFKPNVIPTADPAAATETLFKKKEYGNAPHAGLWMLVLDGSVSPKQFLCKSDSFAGDPAGTRAVQARDGSDGWFGNFQSGKNISYSVAYYWMEDALKKPIISPIWMNNVDSSQPLMSDAAPYLFHTPIPPSTAPVANHPQKVDDTQLPLSGTNSRNHGPDGQNVVYGDYHVDFVRTPLAGQNHDNIWAIRKSADKPKTDADREEVAIEAGKLPHPIPFISGDTDVVMVPQRDEKGNWK